jgi:hypothetical protein
LSSWSTLGSEENVFGSSSIEERLLELRRGRLKLDALAQDTIECTFEDTSKDHEKLRAVECTFKDRFQDKFKDQDTFKDKFKSHDKDRDFLAKSVGRNADTEGMADVQRRNPATTSNTPFLSARATQIQQMQMLLEDSGVHSIEVARSRGGGGGEGDGGGGKGNKRGGGSQNDAEILSSKASVALQVEVQGDELVIKTLGRGGGVGEGGTQAPTRGRRQLFSDDEIASGNRGTLRGATRTSSERFPAGVYGRQTTPLSLSLSLSLSFSLSRIKG